MNAAVAALTDPASGISATFWDPANARYSSMVNATKNGGGPYQGSGINVDVLMASVYGAIPCTNPRLLSSAAQILSTFQAAYAINAQDAAAPGVGPMIGRYPGDTYDGDADSGTDHPWAPCTANFAQLSRRFRSETSSSVGPGHRDATGPPRGPRRRLMTAEITALPRVA